MGMARRTVSRAICANSYCSTTRKGTTRATAAAGTRCSAPATPTKPPAAKYASARLHVQLAEHGTEHVTACRAAHSAATKHAPAATHTATTTTEAAIQRRRKTEQKTAFWHTEPNVRQSRLQPTSTSLPGRLRRSELGLWAPSRRSLVEFVGSIERSKGWDGRIFTISLFRFFVPCACVHGMGHTFI